MAVIDRSSFVVIDLDDTLFAEADYERSGLLAVAATVRELFDIDVEQKLLRWHDVGAPDVFGWLATHLGLHPAAKESFLWTYRLHRPAIVLADSVAATLADLRQVAAGIAILTDGRSITQRRKLVALGIANVEVFISEEWGGDFKPDPRRYLEVMRRHPGCRFVYVADNPAKDFQAPHRLGWATVGVGSGCCRTDDDANRDRLPDVWVSEFADVRDLVDHTAQREAPL